MKHKKRMHIYPCLLKIHTDGDTISCL